MDKSFMLTLCQVKSVERIGFFVSMKLLVIIALQRYFCYVSSPKRFQKKMKRGEDGKHLFIFLFQ